MEHWPSLDGIKFISGRPAQEVDVDEGAAVFVLKADEEYIGTPINLEIPQYAMHYDEAGNAKKVVVIQAEEARGQKVVGAVEVGSGQLLAALLQEFLLLGSDPAAAVNKPVHPSADAPAD